MKVVINNACSEFGKGMGKNGKDFLQRPYWRKTERTKQDLIEFVENNPYECGDLAIAIVPDEATDWVIYEYDGLEQVIYVLDGKIHYAEVIDGRNEWNTDDDWD